MPTRKEARSEWENSQLEAELGASSLTVFLQTPLLYQNLYDARFATFGNQILLALPLTQLGETSALHLEFGIGMTYSSLTIEQPSTRFSHIYFLVPVTLRYLLALSPTLFLDLVGGLVYRPLEYDSRPTEDGGFHSVTSASKINPEAGVGMIFSLSPHTRARFRLSYLFLAAGIEFRF